MKTSPCLLLLAFSACAAPGSVQPATGLQVGGSPLATPKTYSDWVDSLPVLEMDSTAFRTSAQGQISMHLQKDGLDLEFDIQLGVDLEYLDLRHFREDIWIHVEMPDIPELTDFEQLDMAIFILADGERLYITPEFEDDGLGAQIKASGLGIEDMTMTLDIKLFEELVQLYWHFLEDADVDLSALLPDGMSVDEFFGRGLNPAGWARAYMLMSDILDFQVDSNEVRIKARMKKELLGNPMLKTPGQIQQLGDLRYEMSFNRFTGLPASMTMTMKIEEAVSMVLELDFAEFEMGADLFKAGHFNSEHIDRKHLFPIDTFVQMALASMQAGITEDDGDMAF